MEWCSFPRVHIVKKCKQIPISLQSWRKMLTFLIFFFFFPCIQEFELQGEISFEEHCKHIGFIAYGLFPLQVTLIFFCSGTGEAWRGDLTACHLQWLDLLCTCKSLAKYRTKQLHKAELYVKIHLVEHFCFSPSCQT